MHNYENPLFTKIAGKIVEKDRGTPLYEDLNGNTIRIPGYGDVHDIYPRNDGQAQLIAALDLGYALNLVEGPEGAGKTFLCVAHAISTEYQRRELNGQKAKGDFRRFVFVKPLVGAGEEIGTLPGGIGTKVSPSLQGFFDALRHFFDDSFNIPEDDENGLCIVRVENFVFEIAPLAFMRGRDIENAYFFMDESQNTTFSQLMMFCTRSAEGTIMYVMGDRNQCDLKPVSNSGLPQLYELLEYAPEATSQKDSHTAVQLFESERSPIVKRLVAARAARNKVQEGK